ncbi:MAG TPA: PQQ-dependent sugar dehydrogenase [Propionibacteriaceae bacterium]
MVSRRTVLLGSASAILGLAGCGGASEPTLAPTAGGSGSATPTPSPTSASPSATATSSPSATASPGPTGKPDPEVASTIADDLDVPWGIVFLASGDALVSERNTARILRVTAKGKVTRLGEVSGVASPDGLGEGGLLGLALAPGDDDTLFAYLTSRSDNRVVRIDISGGRIRTPKAVLTGIPTSTHHHGGRLVFDPDGMLLVSTGDAEESALAQSKTSLAGKILRIRPDGRAASGNPFGNRTWSYGHRNIEGLAFDADGRLWATEFGDKEADELNLITKGKNYGWPRVEGRSSNAGYVSPKAVWSPTSSCSPAGLAITRSTAFVGALQGKCLFSVALDGTSAAKPKAHFAGDHGRIRNVVVAPDGALWVTTSNTDGRVDPGADDDKILRVSL